MGPVSPDARGPAFSGPAGAAPGRSLVDPAWVARADALALGQRLAGPSDEWSADPAALRAALDRARVLVLDTDTRLPPEHLYRDRQRVLSHLLFKLQAVLGAQGITPRAAGHAGRADRLTAGGARARPWRQLMTEALAWAQGVDPLLSAVWSSYAYVPLSPGQFQDTWTRYAHAPGAASGVNDGRAGARHVLLRHPAAPETLRSVLWPTVQQALAPTGPSGRGRPLAMSRRLPVCWPAGAPEAPTTVEEVVSVLVEREDTPGQTIRDLLAVPGMIDALSEPLTYDDVPAWGATACWQLLDHSTLGGFAASRLLRNPYLGAQELLRVVLSLSRTPDHMSWVLDDLVAARGSELVHGLSPADGAVLLRAVPRAARLRLLSLRAQRPSPPPGPGVAVDRGGRVGP